MTLLEKKGGLVSNSIIYTLGLILQKASVFLLIPLYTFYLDSTDFGIFTLVRSMESFILMVYLMSLHGAGSRYHADYQKDPEELKALWGTLFIFVIFNTALIVALLFLTHAWILDPIAEGVSFFPFMMMGLFSSAGFSLYMISQYFLQSHQVAKRFTLNNITYYLMNAILVVIFLAYLKWKVFGALLAFLITNSTFALYTLIRYRDFFAKGFHFRIFKKCMCYSLPLIPHSLASTLMLVIDRFLLNHMHTTATVGLYGLGYQFGMVMMLITQGVHQAFLPWFFERMKAGKEGRRQIGQFAKVAVSVYAWIALGLALFSKELLFFTTAGEFHESWQIVPLIAFAYAFNGVYFFVSSPIFIAHTRWVPAITFTSLTLSVSMNIYLIPYLGMMGAAISSLSAMFCTSLLAFFLCRKIESTIFSWKQIYLPLLSCFCCSLISFYDPEPGIQRFLIVKVVVFLGIAYCIYKQHSQEILKGIRHYAASR